MIFEYIIKSVFSLSIFYLGYSLFLNRSANFNVNRIYLLFSLIASFILPHININISSAEINPVANVLLSTVNISDNTLSQVVTSQVQLWAVIIKIYFAGLTFFLLRFILKLSQIIFIILKNGVIDFRGQKVVFTSQQISPFSFFNFIFISKNSKTLDYFNKIFIHEKAHVSQHHSIDIVVVELLTIVQWFNPIAWMYKRSLQSVHEFLADRYVLNHDGDTLNYQKILFSQATGLAYNSIVNNFNKSLLKKRLVMMKKKESKKWSSLGAGLILPIVGVLLVSFSTIKGNSFTIVNSTSPQLVQETIISADNDSVFTLVETMPVFSKGGDKGIREYIAKNVKYPKKAIKNGIRGKVYVSFVINKEGKVTNVKNARTTAEMPNKKGKMVSCEAPSLTKEALRVISSMPDFSPGVQRGKTVNVSYTVPINFNLD